MKILIGFIINGQAGGVDKYIMDFYKKIHGKYADVDILTSTYTNDLASQLKKNGSHLWVCPKIMNAFGQYRTLKNTVSENKYDIVYFNYSTAIGWVALKGACDGGAKKIILHSHNSGFVNNNALIEKFYRIAHYISRPVIRGYVTDYLSCSDKAAKWMFGQKTVLQGKVIYIKNEIDDTAYSPSEEKRCRLRAQYGIANDFVIGNVGGLIKAKNQSFLIKMIPQLKKYIPNVKLLLVGEGEDREHLEKLTKRLGLTNDVIFTGYLNTKDGIMNAFNIFCLPSYIEGYPYVSVEAQRLRIPCIFSDCISRQIVHTNACAFVSTKKPELWVKQILEYKNTESKTIEFIKNESDEKFISVFEFITGLLNDLRK